MDKYLKSRLFVGLAFLVLAVILIVGYNLNEDLSDQGHTENIFAMDTAMTLTAYGDDANAAVSAAQKEIFRLDALLSIIGQNSEIAKLNATHTFDVSDDTENLLMRAAEVSESTGGLFDITISPIMDLWGFRTDQYKVPDSSQLATLLKEVDYTKVSIDDGKVTLPADIKIDLGGIAKGYASDRVMDIFRAHGITSGIITLGGNVQALGQHPEGRPWNVAIVDPFNADQTFATVQIEDKAAVTSGGYQRYFTEGGITYHHIIDPRTGYPADSGLVSVTIISADGTLADGLSTSLFIMGLEDASDYWRAHRDQFDAVLVTADGTAYVTEDLVGSFTMADGTEAVIIS